MWKNLNEKLLAFFILSNSIQMIIYFYTNISLPFQYLYLGMVIVAFIYNDYKLKKEFVFLSAFIGIFVIINYILFPVQRDYLFKYIQEFVVRGGVGIFLLSYLKDYKKLFQYLYGLALLNTVFLLPVPFIFEERYLIVRYMSYGYYLLNGLIILTIHVFYFKKHLILNGILILLSIFILSIYGAKGNLLLILFLLAILFFYNLNKLKYLLYTIPFLLLFIFKLEDILGLLHIESYSIKTIIMIFKEEGFLYHSRLNIFIDGFNYIKAHPIFNGIGAFELVHDGLYPHNFLLQILIEFGVFLGFFIIITLGFYTIKTIINIPRKSFQALFLVYLIVEVSKLMISRNYWTEPSFWLFVLFIMMFNMEVKEMKLLYIGDFIKGNGPSTVDLNLYEHLNIKKRQEQISKSLSLKNFFWSNGLIVSGISFKGVLSIILSKVFFKKTIYIMHGLLDIEKEYREISKYRLFFERLTILLSSKIVCVSKALEEDMKKRYKKDKFTSINNGINIKLKNKANKKSEHLILSVGGGRREKNILEICEAISLIDNQNIKYIVVGEDGPDTERIKEYDFVEYKGFISKDELNVIYQDAKLFVQNSIYEPFGIAPLEAIMNGCNVLLSEHVNLKDYIDISDESIIYDDDSLEVIKDKIINHLNFNQNIKIDEEVFDWKVIASKYEGLISDIT